MEQKKRQLAYFRKKKNTYRETKKRRKPLVYLLGNGIKQLQGVLDMSIAECMGADDFSCLRTIRKVLVQQTFLLDHQPKELKDTSSPSTSPMSGLLKGARKTNP